MADITLNIQGNSAAAVGSVDQLIAKLGQLDAQLQQISARATSAFGAFNNISGGGMTDITNRLDDIERRLDALSANKAASGLEKTARATNELGKAASKSSGFLDKMGKSIGRIAFYRLLRTLIKNVASALKEGLNNAYEFSKLNGGPLAQAMDKVKASASQLKNQLGAAFGALLTSIAPAIVAVINLLTKLAEVITMVFSLLAGKGTYKAASEGFSDVESSAGGAGKKVKGLLAAWDELTVIGQEKGGGGGGKMSDQFADLFEEKPIPSWLQEMWDKTTGLKETIEGIKKVWNRLVELFKKGDFKDALQIFFLDPLHAVLSAVENVLLLLEMLFSGDWIGLGFAAVKTIFDSFIDSVVLPFTRTIDAIFGTDLSSSVLNFKNAVDGGFRELFDTGRTKKWTQDFKNVFSGIGNWFKETFGPAVEWLKNLFSGLWQIIRAGLLLFWNSIKKPVLTAVSWVLDNVIHPVAKFFAECFDTIRNALAVVWLGIRNALAKAINWIINNIINPIVDKINGIGRIAAGILGETWKEIDHVGEIAIKSIDDIETNSTSAADAVERAFSGIGKAIEKELSADPVINFHYNNAPSGMNSANTSIAMPFAEGGFVSTGQLFVAREAGPEMVGSIGSHTAVANNDQIVAGIASGVREAESEQNALLRQQNAILAQLLSKEFTISPSAALGQVVARSSALYARS